MFDYSVPETVSCPVKTIYIPSEIRIFLSKKIHKDVTNKLKNFRGLCNDVNNATHLIVNEEKTIDVNVLQAILKGLFIYKEQCKVLINLAY